MLADVLFLLDQTPGTLCFILLCSDDFKLTAIL